MKKTSFIKLTALLFALIASLSLVTPAALAANETVTPITAESTTLTDAETALAEYRAEVLRLVNVEREKVGVAALKEMASLVPMADVRAQESASSFSHTRPNGTRCFTIFADNAVKYSAAGENLAYGFKTPAAVVAAWMNSEGHRRNILDAAFKFVGTGYFVNENGRIYTSQLFYTPKAGK